MKIWLTVVPFIFVSLAIRACVPTLAIFQDWNSFKPLLGVVLISTLLSLFSAGLLGWPIFASIYHKRLLKNGGPFKVGDSVQILVGKHKGRIGRIYSLWQGNSVRVALGETEKKSFKDVFASSQLLKEQCEPGASLVTVSRPP